MYFDASISSFIILSVHSHFLTLITYYYYFLCTVNERTRKKILSGHLGSNKSKPSNSRVCSVSRATSVSKTKVGPDSTPKSSVTRQLNIEQCQLNLSDRKMNVSGKFANSLSPVRRAINEMGELNDSEEFSNGVDDIEKNIPVDAKEVEGGHVIYVQASGQYVCLDSESPNYSPQKNFPVSNDVNDFDKIALCSI